MSCIHYVYMTTIRISTTGKNKLARMKRKGESFEDVINRLEKNRMDKIFDKIFDSQDERNKRRK